MERKEITPEHKELMKELGRRIKDLRTGEKISYIRMAEQIGISRNSYNLLELGNVYFNFSTILVVLDYHHISLSDFFKDL